MNATNDTTAANRDHIILLGKELELASGIHAYQRLVGPQPANH